MGENTALLIGGALGLAGILLMIRYHLQVRALIKRERELDLETLEFVRKQQRGWNHKK